MDVATEIDPAFQLSSDIVPTRTYRAGLAPPPPTPSREYDTFPMRNDWATELPRDWATARLAWPTREPSLDDARQYESPLPPGSAVSTATARLLVISGSILTACMYLQPLTGPELPPATSPQPEHARSSDESTVAAAPSFNFAASGPAPPSRVVKLAGLPRGVTSEDVEQFINVDEATPRRILDVLFLPAETDSDANDVPLNLNGAARVDGALVELGTAQQADSAMQKDGGKSHRSLPLRVT